MAKTLAQRLSVRVGMAAAIAMAAAPLHAADGADLYVENECAGCHEVTVVPGQVVIPLEGLAKRHEVATLVKLLDEPRSPMPRFELSDPEREALARYLLTRFP